MARFKKILLLLTVALTLLVIYRLPEFYHDRFPGKKPQHFSVKLSNGSSGSLSVVSYNTAGLPFYAYILASPRRNHINAGRALAAENADIIVTQEDFAYQSYLAMYLNRYPYYSRPHYSDSNNTGLSDGMLGSISQAGWALLGNLNAIITRTNDGLSRFSKIPFSAEKMHKEKWNTCSNWEHVDCLAPKGFSAAEHILSENNFILVYNLHADAGAGVNDQVARRAQMQQLLNHLEKTLAERGSRPVIIAGDFNLFYEKQRSGDRELFTWLKSEHHFTDACESAESLDCNNYDKVLYRGDDRIDLTVADYHKLNIYVGYYSDHAPVKATLKWKVRPAGSPASSSL